MYPLLCTAKSGGFRAVTTLGLALTALFAVTAHGTVGIAGAPVRSRWFVLLALAVVATVPLAARFEPVERALAHPLRCFASRLAVAAVPFTLGLGACVVLVPTDDALRLWFVLLTATGIAVCAFAPEGGWLASLVLGSSSILVDHMSSTLPVSNALVTAGPLSAALALAAAAAIYLRRSGAPRLHRPPRRG